MQKLLPEAVQNISQVQVGDKITKINNKSIRLKSDITKALKDYKDGENIEITVIRNGEELLIQGKPTEYQENYYILGIEVALNQAILQDKLYYSFWETVDFVSSIR